MAYPLAAEIRDLLLFAVYTGMRQGELWGLRWRDIELDGRMPRVTVRRSHDRSTKSKRAAVPAVRARRRDLAAPARAFAPPIPMRSCGPTSMVSAAKSRPTQDGAIAWQRRGDAFQAGKPLLEFIGACASTTFGTRVRRIS